MHFQCEDRKISRCHSEDTFSCTLIKTKHSVPLMLFNVVICDGDVMLLSIFPRGLYQVPCGCDADLGQEGDFCKIRHFATGLCYATQAFMIVRKFM